MQDFRKNAVRFPPRSGQRGSAKPWRGGGRGAQRPFRRRRNSAGDVGQIRLFRFLAFLGRVIARAVLPPHEFDGVVCRIIDGDTLCVRGLNTRIRLWGVDAPEIGAPGAKAATAALKGFAARRRLRFRKITIDRYGRIVARCYLADGRDISALMIESGAAKEYVYYTWGFYRLRRFLRGRSKAGPS